MNKVYKRLYIVVFLFILILLLNFFSVNLFSKSFEFIANINTKLEQNDSTKLSYLFVKDYNTQINFDKDTNNYNITIFENVYYLEVSVTLESENATVAINNNDYLEGNSGTVSIVVTNGGNTNTYNVNWTKVSANNEAFKQEFSYTNEAQIFTAPKFGKYKIEL